MARKISKDTIERRNELTDSITNSYQDLAGLVETITSQMNILSQSDSSFALSWVKDAEKAINEFNNIGLSPDKRALNDLNTYFDGSSGKNFIKDLLTDAVKNGGDDYVSLNDYIKKAKELYDKGLVGTDDFKSVAEAISYGIDSSAESFKANYDKLQRYFIEDKDCHTKK